MDASNLVKMANRIGDFFEAMPDHEDGLDGIATHIKKFWEPRMRKQIWAHIDSGAEGMHPMVLEAIRKYVPVPA